MDQVDRIIMEGQAASRQVIRDGIEKMNNRKPYDPDKWIDYVMKMWEKAKQQEGMMEDEMTIDEMAARVKQNDYELQILGAMDKAYDALGGDVSDEIKLRMYIAAGKAEFNRLCKEKPRDASIIVEASLRITGRIKELIETVELANAEEVANEG